MGASVFFAGPSEVAVLTDIFYDVNGVLVDPTTVELVIHSPAGVMTDLQTSDLSNPSVGTWTVDFDCSSEFGEWTYDWISTGVGEDHETGTWTVWETDLGHLYFPIQALKSRLGISDLVDDYELHAACFAASRHVENICQRNFWRTASPEARIFQPDGWYQVDLPEFCDLVSITDLSTDDNRDGIFENSWNVSDYQLRPVNPTVGAEPAPYTQIRAAYGRRIFPPPWISPLYPPETVQVTGIWGWDSPPQAVRQATAILAAELFKLKDAPFGVAAGFGDTGFRIKDNPVVDRLLGPYKRTPVLVG